MYQVGNLAPFGQAMVEQRAPARRVRRRVVRVGEPEVDQCLDRVRLRVGLRAACNREGFFQLLERQRVHGENQIIEVCHDVIDRADRAADLVGELARLQPAQTIRRDGTLGGGDQRVPQFAPPRHCFRLVSH